MTSNNDNRSAFLELLQFESDLRVLIRTYTNRFNALNTEYSVQLTSMTERLGHIRKHYLTQPKGYCNYPQLSDSKFLKTEETSEL